MLSPGDCACQQLQAWRERGYKPQLYSNEDGWSLKLDNTNYTMDDEYPALRFITNVYPSIETAVEAALQVIQP